VKAERDLAAIKKARFIEKFLGQEFKGVISSVTKFGVFVLIKELGVDGLIHVDQLSDQFDQFDFDEQKLCLRGRRSKMVYKIGDPIQIIVAAANPIDGKIDFVRAGSKFSQIKETTKLKDFKKRPHSQKPSKNSKEGEITAHSFRIRSPIDPAAPESTPQETLIEATAADPKAHYRPVMSLQDILENANKSTNFDPQKVLEKVKQSVAFKKFEAKSKEPTRRDRAQKTKRRHRSKGKRR
jgi:ribosomal protein S1